MPSVLDCGVFRKASSERQTTMQRIAVISDIHGNILALQAVVADMERRRIDGVVNVGDHLSGPLWPRETIAFLMRQSWIQICGNQDRQVAFEPPDTLGPSNAFAAKELHEEGFSWLRSLPPRARIDGDVLSFHGTPRSDSEYLLETIAHGRVRPASEEEIEQRLGGERASLMICGHTHIQRVIRLPNCTTIVNPGSVGLPAYSDEVPASHSIENGSPHARYMIVERCGQEWNVESFVIAYDAPNAAACARGNGRLDWAIALETGRVPA